MDERAPERAAAALRLVGADAQHTLALVAGRLQALLPQHTTVRRRGFPLPGRERAVASVAVVCGEQTFSLACDGAALVAERASVVRGIPIRTEPLELATWLRALVASVEQQGETAAAAQSALADLLSLE